jgi:hypothetical protein
MAYFKINGVDFSAYTSSLKVARDSNYNAQTNAAGNTVVDYINTKRTIEVGIIALDSSVMPQIQAEIDKFSVALSFVDPRTGGLVEGVNCIIPSTEIEFYTIQIDKTMYKAFDLTFTEL